MPLGDLTTVVVLALFTALAVAAPRPSRSSPFRVSFALNHMIIEWPFLIMYYLMATILPEAVRGGYHGPIGWAGLALAAVTLAGVAVLVWRARLARPVLDAALRSELGHIAPRSAPSGSRRIGRWIRILLWPFPLFDPRVDRVRNISYGDAGRGNVLDLYRPRRRPADGPTLIYLHGGAFRMGSKNSGAQPLMHRLARQGWVCVNANYRIGRHTVFPDQLVDLKAVIAWVREHGVDEGADPEAVFLAGSSAGAHLCATAALTANEPQFQPGFERTDTSVSGAILLSAYLGPIDTRGPPSSPHDYIHAGAPPFFVVHGERDSLVVPRDAQRFADELGSTSSNPVVYCELPGGQHAPELYFCIRFEAVIDAIETFTSTVRTGVRTGGAK